MAPEAVEELLPPLLAAYAAVLTYQPFSAKPAAAPWDGPALAFEASWADTHSLLVAVRLVEPPAPAAQLTLRRAGQLEFAINTSHEQLAEAVRQCLNRQNKRLADHARRLAQPPGTETAPLG